MFIPKKKKKNTRKEQANTDAINTPLHCYVLSINAFPPITMFLCNGASHKKVNFYMAIRSDGDSSDSATR